MIFLPICLNIEKHKILIVGGGKVAREKLRTLSKYTLDITVCAPHVLDEIKALGVHVIETSYTPAVLAGHSILFACTNEREVNHRISQDATARGLLACAADDPAHSDFISPAIYKEGQMSVAVTSNGTDVKRSISWRNAVQKFLEWRAGESKASPFASSGIY